MVFQVSGGRRAGRAAFLKGGSPLPDDLYPSDAVTAARAALAAVERLSLFVNVTADPAVRALRTALEAVAACDASALEAARRRFLGCVAEAAARRDVPPPEAARSLSAWQLLLLERVSADENAFTLQAEHTPTPPSGLLALASADLRCLQSLYDAPDRLAGLLDPDGILRGLILPVQPDGAADPMDAVRAEPVRILARAADWGAAAPELARWLHAAGAGLFGRYAAFRWERPAASEADRAGALRPIPRPDWIRLDQLIEYESERQIVLHNTEKFMLGLPAHNVLLYGERGTGKSATVKALLHAFAPRGLRMVEVPRQSLGDLPEIITQLGGRGRRFILFVDDLSFDDGDATYKELKAVLEGTLEGRPRNVLVYATSNRRHLVQERFSDRAAAVGDDGEVHPQDTLEEKLSLADRFGITVVFPSPDQRRFLAIVEGLARQRGLDVPPEELRQAALRWAVWHNGRSARTAKQFIDDLEGERRLRTRSTG